MRILLALFLLAVAGCGSTPTTPPVSGSSVPDKNPLARSSDKDKDAPRDAPPEDPNPSELLKVVEGYVAAKKWQGRLPFVINPEKVSPQMEREYGDEELDRIPGKVTFRFAGRHKKPVDHCVVKMTLQAGVSQREYEFLLRYTPKGYRIDWEASFGINDASLKTFLFTRHQPPAFFRLACSLSDYYNYAFRGTEQTHLSIEIREMDYSTQTSKVRATGYVLRDSPAGRRLAEILKDGKEHRLILELDNAGPYGDPISTSGTRTVTIKRLISESWFLD